MIGIHCLKYDESRHKCCEYLDIGTTRVQLLLTDSNGNVVNSKGYWGDIDMTEEEWIEEKNGYR